MESRVAERKIKLSAHSTDSFLNDLAQRYDPTELEILECAKWLGINPEEEKHLFWIAKEALSAPLQEDWKPCKREDDIYYFNFETGESVWDRPCDKRFFIVVQDERKKTLVSNQDPQTQVSFSTPPSTNNSRSFLQHSFLDSALQYVDGRWDAIRKGRDVILSNNGATAMRTNEDNWGAVLGEQIFENGIETVAFRIEKKQWYVFVGLAGSDIDLDLDPSLDTKSIVLGGGLGNFIVFGTETVVHGGGYDSGDVIRVEVNMDMRIATFFKNELEICRAHDLHSGMRPFLSLGDLGSAVRIQHLNGFSYAQQMINARAKGFQTKDEAEKGFETADEMRVAMAKGFQTKAEASRGFATAREMKEALASGFHTKAEVDRGFSSLHEMRLAQERGFHTKSQMQKGFDTAHEMCHAQSLGFQTKQEMVRANSHGFQNAADWHAAKLMVHDNMRRALAMSEEDELIFTDPYAAGFSKANCELQLKSMKENLSGSFKLLESASSSNEDYAQQRLFLKSAIDACYNDRGELVVNLQEWMYTTMQIVKQLPILALERITSEMQIRVGKAIELIREQVNRIPIRIDKVFQVIHRAETYMQYLQHRHATLQDHMLIQRVSIDFSTRACQAIQDEICKSLESNLRAANMSYESAQASLQAAEHSVKLSRSARNVATSTASLTRSGITDIDLQVSRLEDMESQADAAKIGEIPAIALQLVAEAESSSETNIVSADELLSACQVYAEMTLKIVRSTELELERVKSVVPVADAAIKEHEEKMKTTESDYATIVPEIALLESVMKRAKLHKQELEDLHRHTRQIFEAQIAGLERLKVDLVQTVNSRKSSHQERLRGANLNALSLDDICTVLMMRGLENYVEYFIRHGVAGNVLHNMFRTSSAAHIRFDDELDDFLEGSLQIKDMIIRKQIIHLIQLLQHGLDIGRHCPNHMSTFADLDQQPCCTWTPQMVAMELKKRNMLHLAEELGQVTGDVLLLLHRRKDLIKLGIVNVSEQQRVMDMVHRLADKDPVGRLRHGKPLSVSGLSIAAPSDSKICTPSSPSSLYASMNTFNISQKHEPHTLSLSPGNGTSSFRVTERVDTPCPTPPPRVLPISPSSHVQAKFCAVPFSTISEATNDFSQGFEVGEGTLGKVYRCKLSGLGPHGSVLDCAIKRMNGQFLKSGVELRKEIEALLLCKHEHLVPLVAVCLDAEAGDRSLIFPFIAGGSLDNRLLDSTSPMHWSLRIRVAVELLRAVTYLHAPSRSKPKILHMNIKPQNILFDEHEHTRLSDVGLVSISASKSTMGYICPIFVSEGHFYPTCDGFSVGVVALQLLTGLPAIHPDSSKQPRALAARMRRAGAAATAAASDPEAGFPAQAAQTLSEVACLLVQQEAEDRISLLEALQRLEVLHTVEGIRAEAQPTVESRGRAVGTPPRTAHVEFPAENYGMSCSVCLVAPRDSRLIAACGHRSTACAACADALEERGCGPCPACRTAVGSKTASSNSFRLAAPGSQGKSARPWPATAEMLV